MAQKMGQPFVHSINEVRRSTEAAGAILCELLPSALKRKQILRICAECIQYADACASGKWGVTIFPSLLRVKVGMIEVMVITDSFFHVVLHTTSVPPNVRRSKFLDFKDAAYRSVRSNTRCAMEIALAPKLWPEIRKSHQKLLRLAALTQIHPTTIGTHSPGAIQFMSAQLNQLLPQPRYLRAAMDDKSATLPEEIAPSEEYMEGAVSQVLVDRFERDPRAKAACIRHYGYRCVVCKKTLEDLYGQAAKGLIHVHHLVPISKFRSKRRVDPIRDLRPVCPNCHAVIHSADPIHTLEIVSMMIRR